MKGYVGDLEKAAEENKDFRRVLYTAKHLQLVLMRLRPGEEIGEEEHDLDQFIRIEGGEGIATLDGVEHPIEDDSGILIPQGVRHNIKNTSTTEDLILYTLYAPPEHKDGVVHQTKADAVEEHFDGTTTE